MFRTTPLLIAVALALGPMAVLGLPAIGQQPTLGDPGEALIIGLEPEAAAALQVGDKLHGLKVHQVSTRGAFAVVQAPGLHVASSVGAQPGVTYVERDVHVTTAYSPDDRYYGEQWGLGKIGAPAAWDTTRGSASVTVAVLDTGVLRSHQDLAGARLLGGYDFHRGDSVPEDECGHGTHVAGIVGATTHNGVGVAGVAQATILPVKVLGPVGSGGCSGSHSNIARGIYHAVDNGADVIVMSLGGSSSSATLKNAVDHAWSKGVLVVAAAGNTHGGSIMYPAAYTSAIAVGSVDSDLDRSSFSAVGPQMEVAAPGRGIVSTYHSSDRAYVGMSGTSMAAPHVAGVLALAVSVSPDSSAYTLRDTMKTTAQDLGATGHDTSFGHGLVRADLLVSALAGPTNTAPTASFATATEELRVTVDAAGSHDADGDTLAYSWTWGDGLSGSGRTATHTYATSGTYTIRLTVTDGNGGSDTAQKSITVAQTVANKAPYANFDWTYKRATAHVDAARSYDPEGSALSYAWTWGDGTSGTGKTASHTYAKGGTYSVKLTVTDAKGLSSSTTKSVSVTSDNDRPFANFDWAWGYGRDIWVDASRSSDPDGHTLTYTWDWGDGATTSGIKDVHSYQRAGTFPIKLTVTDSNGGSDSIVKWVSFENGNQAPVANFDWARGYGRDIHVDPAPSSDPDGEPLTYQWNWGDGTYSTGGKQKHAYAAGGTYKVTLTVTDPSGATGTLTKTVQV